MRKVYFDSPSLDHIFDVSSRSATVSSNACRIIDDEFEAAAREIGQVNRLRILKSSNKNIKSSLGKNEE